MLNETYFPFLVELLNSADRTHRCLGTLVAPDVVLTAAHCLYDASVLVRLGPEAGSGSATTRLFVVRSTWTHPSYFYNTYTGGVDVDPYDAALIQVYGRAAAASNATPTSLMRLNRNASLFPGNRQGSESPPRGQLVGIGWNQHQSGGAAAAETTLLAYVPNDRCVLINGTTSDGTFNVSYASQVIDVTLCALYQQGPGLCPGDSGGPLLVLDSVTGPVQAGITSSSYGCRNPVLPTLNVRTSSVSDWIDAIVCNATSYAVPNDYPCSRGWMDGDEAQPSMVEIAVQLELGSRPASRGWILYQILDDHGRHRSLPRLERPLGYYSQLGPHSNVTETLKLADGFRFELVVLDVNDETASEGSAGSLRLWSDGLPMGNWSLDGTMGARVISFVLGTLPTPSPSVPMPVHQTNKPVDEAGEPYLSVVIELDSYPMETGFRVEAINDTSDAAVSSAPNLIYEMYPGSFGPEKAHSEVQVNVSLPVSYRRFRFTMTDNEHDGLEPPAFYEAWLGPRNNSGTLVARGGVFFLEDPHEFSVPESHREETKTPTSSPSPTRQPVVRSAISSGSTFYSPLSLQQAPIISLVWLILMVYRF